MGATGIISPDAQSRALDALAQCAEKLNRRNVSVARSVATEACRRATNGPDFVARVFEETGIALDVISPAEEARLAVLGCQSLLDDRSEEHTSELQSLMRTSYAVFCLRKKRNNTFTL